MSSGPGEALRSATTTGAPRTTTRSLARVLAVLAYAALLLLWVRRFGVPSDTVQIFGWLWLATIAWNVEAPWRYHLGFLRDWWVPIAGLVVYFYSRGLADEFGFEPHFQMPITVDTWLGGGVLPSERLQDALCGDPCDKYSHPAWYDVVLTSVYSTHFVVGLTVAMVLWLRNRGEWMKWMRRYVGANVAALVVYIVYPMAPPWMAWQEGYLPGEVLRLTHRGWADTGIGRFHLVLTGVGNPVAAMPSLHAGIAVLIAAYAIQRWRSPWRWLLAAYPLTMSFALVYYGEHYVIDILAGALLAFGVLAACSFWERSRGT
jgi:membrane-associated phospholipid phosphatase